MRNWDNGLAQEPELSYKRVGYEPVTGASGHGGGAGGALRLADGAVAQDGRRSRPGRAGSAGALDPAPHRRVDHRASGPAGGVPAGAVER
eukprot:7340426-Pyramimonas_sp.AAC.1